MSEFAPRLFGEDAQIERLGEGLLACSLARADWTHEAHLAVTAYLLLRRPDIDLDAQLPGLIRAFNESVGGINDDTQGYHDTITKVFLMGVRRYLSEVGEGASLVDTVNGLLGSDMGRRDWPRRFYSEERLMSVEARRGFVAPDLAPLS